MHKTPPKEADLASLFQLSKWLKEPAPAGFNLIRQHQSILRQVHGQKEWTLATGKGDVVVGRYWAFRKSKHGHLLISHVQGRTHFNGWASTLAMVAIKAEALELEVPRGEWPAILHKLVIIEQ